MKRAGENPFDLTKASDYTDVQIRDFWVNIIDETNGLVGVLKPTLLTPMFLLGGKGSGKTHLMRYCSTSVQSLRFGGDLGRAACQEGFLGIYSQADGLNVYRFAGKGQSEEVWSTVFAYAFELWLASNFLRAISPAIDPKLSSDSSWNHEFVRLVGQIFHIPLDASSSFTQIQELLNRTQRSIDLTVNNCAITRSLDEITIGFNPGELIFGLPKIMQEICSSLKDTVFVYLIDEVENLTVGQQRFLNTLVRYRKGNATIKIGARLYGIKTHETLGSGEPIKRDAEFVSVELDALLRENEERYRELAKALILRRVKEFHDQTELTVSMLDGCFEEVQTDNYYASTTLALVESRQKNGLERPHLKRLREALQKTTRFSDSATKNLLEVLAFPDNPLLEKVNLLAFYKRLVTDQPLQAIADGIAREAKTLQDKSGGGSKYYDLYSHFASDLLAQLFRDYGRKPNYVGLSTLIHLSQGVPRNLLSLLKHIYRRSAFNGENPFAGGTVSAEAQSQGVADAAEWFWEDAQPDEFGPQVRSAVENLATLFRQIRYSDSPSECDVCCFIVEVDQLTSGARNILDMAENWSFLLRISGMSGAKNDFRIGTKFQLNPMLAARWGLSQHRRGAVELNGGLGDAIFAEDSREMAQKQINRRTERMYLESLLSAALGSTCVDQGNLFR